MVILFLAPWVNGKLAIHDSSEVISLIEFFVLSSATLSLLTFTYIFAMVNLHKKIKNSMEVAGESFFMATVQFIIGLGLFLLVTLIINHFVDPSNITLSFSLDGMVSVVLLSIQLIGVYETASALSKFLKGIFEVYRSFRVVKISRQQLFNVFRK